MYDLNNFYMNGKTRFTNNKYDINGIHKDINISFDEDIDEKKNKKYSLVRK